MMKIIRHGSFEILSRLTRRDKQFVLFVIDAVLPPFVLILAIAIAHNGFRPFVYQPELFYMLPVVSMAGGGASAWLGIPRIQLKSYETTAILRTGAYAALVTVVAAVLSRFILPSFSAAGVVIYGLMLFLLAAGIRMVMLHALLWVLRQGQPKHRVLIYGAGTTGTQLAAALRSHERIVPVAFIDDNDTLHSVTIAGLRVLPRAALKDFVEQRDIDRIILAMPSVSAPKLARLSHILKDMGFKVQSLPSFAQLVGEEELIDNLSPVASGQFLGRAQVGDMLPQGREAYRGRSVLVSGAGGSIGAELCRQLIACSPARIVLYEVSEIALYTIDRELSELAGGTGVEIVPVLGSVTDSRLTRIVIQDHRVEVVFHAAAYKHVPLVEMNPLAGLANNVLGTRTLAEAANDAGVGRFILISSDKAVRPTNIMGASKRLAELVVQDMAKRSRGTVFSMVRFGNVLGSSGSVIPLFKEQIARGGPVTLTHEDVTRYFMTISEAARLVLLAGSFSDAETSSGGDVFVLNMGDPVRIRDMAVQLIHTAGYSVRDEDHPDGDIEIAVTGLRPGEKMHEELLIGAGLLTTPHGKILRAREESLSELELASALRALRSAIATGDQDAAREVVTTWVHGYRPPAVAAAR
ncbi:MAG: polysaccharide biosynthesis protein [Gemmobacter sp.]|jgi:FlaA1/EpsC-like NDP-sugar epimerase|nr:polysaccharide biosynthesis protein [Gemmobacter sp.]